MSVDCAKIRETFCDYLEQGYSDKNAITKTARKLSIAEYEIKKCLGIL